MRSLLTFITSFTSYLILTVAVGHAQVVPDNSLPDNSEVSDELEVTGGTTAGNNLFHSFDEFSVGTGETVFFNNATTIENIISRVTGGNISDIDGLLRANGTADLFLINPNGIVFGENAALDLGGSFISTTADSIEFADGSGFSAANPGATPLLTVSIPVGLQYGNNPGNIIVRGTGNNLTIDPDLFTVDRSERPVGLEVDDANTLALIGGNVFLPGGNLTVAEGRAVIGSVDRDSSVGLIADSLGWIFNYAEVTDFQNIDLFQAASIEASGNGGGEVRLQGKNIRLADGSAILADTLGDSPGRILEVLATDNIELVGFAADESFLTRLSTNVGFDGTQQGGDLVIQTAQLTIAGAEVNSSTFGLGDAGNLEIIATDIEVIGQSFNSDFASGLFAQADVGDTGDGGDLTIKTDSLLVDDGAEISSATFGSGDAGNLNIQANTVELKGFSEASSDGSGLFITSEGEGNGGDLSLETDFLSLTEGAQINATAFGLGNAGNLNIKANNIELSSSSGLFVSTEGEGNGGDLDLNADSLLVADGAEISTTTFSSGNSGNLNIQATEIELIGEAPGFVSSGIFANADEGSSGNSGNLIVATNKLSIADGAQISAITNSVADAGTITINSQSINISGTSTDGIPSTISADVDLSAGAGGDIEITTDSLEVTEGAQISSGTLGTGDGGDLNIVATDFVLLQGSSETGSSGLFANAVESDGTGGNLTVQTSSLAILDGATITVSNFPSSDSSSFEAGQGAAGNLTIIADEIELEDGSSIAADTFAGDRGNINLQTDLLLLRRESQISTNAQGTSTGGNISIDANDGFLVAFPQENSDITANAVFGDGGRVDITALNILGIEPRASLTPLSDITTSSEFGIDGEVSLETQDLNPAEDLGALPNDPNPPELAQGCEAGGDDSNSSFVNIGQGGLSPQPNDSLGADELLGDVRVPEAWLDRDADLVEAENWVVNDRGNVELVADLPSNTSLYNCQL